MRKYVIGGIIGFVLATTAGAYAADVKTMIGEKIDGVFSVKVDGKELSKQAIVIKGDSYLPVRVMSEALNLEVGFDAKKGIELNKKEADSVENQTFTPIPTPTSTLSPAAEKENEIGKLEGRISRVEVDIVTLKFSISRPGSDSNPEYSKWVESLPLKEKELADLQAELAELQK